MVWSASWSGPSTELDQSGPEFSQVDHSGPFTMISYKDYVADSILFL